MFRKFFSIMYLLCCLFLVFAGNAMAAVDLTGVTLDTTTPETLAATILGGLGIMWGIRKLIKLTNKS